MNRWRSRRGRRGGGAATGQARVGTRARSIRFEELGTEWAPTWQQQHRHPPRRRRRRAGRTRRSRVRSWMRRRLRRSARLRGTRRGARPARTQRRPCLPPPARARGAPRPAGGAAAAIVCQRTLMTRATARFRGRAVRRRGAAPPGEPPPRCGAPLRARTRGRRSRTAARRTARPPPAAPPHPPPPPPLPPASRDAATTMLRRRATERDGAPRRGRPRACASHPPPAPAPALRWRARSLRETRRDNFQGKGDHAT